MIDATDHDEIESGQDDSDEGFETVRPLEVAAEKAKPVPGPYNAKKKLALTLARPLNRHHEIIGPGDHCVDCRREEKCGPKCKSPEHFDHQLHLRCHMDKATDEYVGPDAEHAITLLNLGLIADTPQERDRTRKQHAIEVGRGVARSGDEEEVFDGGAVTVRALPELAEPHPNEVKRLWARLYEGGEKAIKERERRELPGRRSEPGEGVQLAAARLVEALGGVAVSETEDDEAEIQQTGAMAHGRGARTYRGRGATAAARVDPAKAAAKLASEGGGE